MRRTIAVEVLTLTLVACLGLSGAYGALYNGVKAGDWIEYSVTYTGETMQGHDIDWARMDILDTQGPLIYVNITSRYPNGTLEATKSTLDLQTGQLIDDFIIPANLTVGDTFLDQNYGNITITRQETQIYAGASRTVLFASIGNNTYVWDQITGVSVEGTSATAQYTIHSLAISTNMWQPEAGLNILIVVSLGILVVALIAIAIAVFLYRKNKR